MKLLINLLGRLIRQITKASTLPNILKKRRRRRFSSSLWCSFHLVKFGFFFLRYGLYIRMVKGFLMFSWSSHGYLGELHILCALKLCIFMQDYVEAAKTAAINQEIKRILTEVLLKVAASLFLMSILYYDLLWVCWLRLFWIGYWWTFWWNCNKSSEWRWYHCWR